MKANYWPVKVTIALPWEGNRIGGGGHDYKNISSHILFLGYKRHFRELKSGGTHTPEPPPPAPTALYSDIIPLVY